MEIFIGTMYIYLRQLMNGAIKFLYQTTSQREYFFCFVNYTALEPQEVKVTQTKKRIFSSWIFCNNLLICIIIQ